MKTRPGESIVSVATYQGQKPVDTEGLEIGEKYIVSIKGKNREVYVSVFTMGGNTKRLIRYPSLPAVMRAWQFSLTDDSIDFIINVGKECSFKEDAQTLFRENKALSMRVNQLINDLNVERAQHAQCKKDLNTLMADIQVDRQNMGKVSEDLDKKLKQALDEANTGREEIADLTAALEQAERGLRETRAENRVLRENEEENNVTLNKFFKVIESLSAALVEVSQKL